VEGTVEEARTEIVIAQPRATRAKESLDAEKGCEVNGKVRSLRKLTERRGTSKLDETVGEHYARKKEISKWDHRNQKNKKNPDKQRRGNGHFCFGAKGGKEYERQRSRRFLTKLHRRDAVNCGR